eukprot:GHVU01089672.1.p1 GENE.GHVU01089672.1~~GHVU01089672.1.p1  ORF type:complete len:460 (-),score=131.73 GHVU01089672.1:683-2062(-)
MARLLEPYLNKDGSLVATPDERILLFKQGLDLRMVELDEDCRRIQQTERRLQRKIDECTLTYETMVFDAQGFAESRLMKQIQEQQRVITLQQRELDELRFQRDLYADETTRLRGICRYGNWDHLGPGIVPRSPPQTPRTLHEHYSAAKPDTDWMRKVRHGLTEEQKLRKLKQADGKLAAEVTRANEQRRRVEDTLETVTKERDSSATKAKELANQFLKKEEHLAKLLEAEKRKNKEAREEVLRTKREKEREDREREKEKERQMEKEEERQREKEKQRQREKEKERENEKQKREREDQGGMEANLSNLPSRLQADLTESMRMGTRGQQNSSLAPSSVGTDEYGGTMGSRQRTVRSPLRLSTGNHGMGTSDGGASEGAPRGGGGGATGGAGKEETREDLIRTATQFLDVDVGAVKRRPSRSLRLKAREGSLAPSEGGPRRVGSYYKARSSRAGSELFGEEF